MEHDIERHNCGTGLRQLFYQASMQRTRPFFGIVRQAEMVRRHFVYADNHHLRGRLLGAPQLEQNMQAKTFLEEEPQRQEAEYQTY